MNPAHGGRGPTPPPSEVSLRPQILLVEDDPDHAELTQVALTGAPMANRVVTCASGEEALDYLRGRATSAQGEETLRPDLILLDLKMPGKGGLEVLKTIKGDPSLATIPVCMLTTSENQEDIRNCYAAGANCYVSKPVRYAEYIRKIEGLGRFWLSTSQTPGTPPRVEAGP